MNVVTNDGTKYQGTLLNEDSFTIQFIDAREQVHSLDKASLKSWQKSRESLMPAYDEKIIAGKGFAGLVGVSGERRRCKMSGRASTGAGAAEFTIGAGADAEILHASSSDGLRMTLLFGLRFVLLTCLLAPSSFAQVTSERLLNAEKEPQNWLMYSGDYAGRRFSTLDEIKTGNAEKLVPKWAYQTMAGGKFETTPLVVDGILYGTGQDDRAFALDARTGRPIWQYQRALPGDIRPCCGRVNRGLAILGDKVFMGDARFACDRAGHENGQCCLGRDGCRLHQGLQLHAGAVGDQELGSGGHFGRRVRHSRIH